MRQTRKILLGSALIAVALCAGCARDSFATVADHLDYNSEYFSVTVAPTTSSCAVDIFRHLENGIAQSENGIATRKMFNMFLCGFELSFRALGCHELAAYGASSRLITEKLFCNKIALLGKVDSAGIAWQMLRDCGQNDLADFSRLPADAEFALQINLDLTSASSKPLPALIALGLFVPDFLSESFTAYDMLEPEFTKNISGTWQLALFQNDRVVLTMPDRDGKLFERMLKKASSGDSEIDTAHNDSGVTINGEMLTLIPGNGTLTFFFGGEETKKIFDRSKALADDQMFCRSAADFPSSATGFFRLKNCNDFCTLRAFGLNTGLCSFADEPQAGFISSENNLILLTGFSSEPLPAQYLVLCSGIAAKLTELFEPAFNKFMADELQSASQQEKAESADNITKVEEQFFRPETLTKEIYPVLAAYRAKYGKFPADPKLDSIPQIVNDPSLTASLPGALAEHIYFYLGDWGKLSSDEMPLLIDIVLPLESENGYKFNVLFCDGGSAEFTAPQESLRQQISILQTAKHYDEERFTEMMSRADFLENQLKQSESSEK